MKRIILSAAALLIGLTSSVVLAQTSAPAPGTETVTTAVGQTPAEARKADRPKKDKLANGKKERRSDKSGRIASGRSQTGEKCGAKVKTAGRKGKSNAFAGITLTPEQQKKVDQLRQSSKESVKKQKQKLAEQRRKERADFDKKMEKILTPEQMAAYKANRAKADAAKSKRAKNSTAKADRKKGHGGQKASRMTAPAQAAS